MVGQEFEHGRTDAAFARSVFDDDEAAVSARYINKECLVERFGKAQIDVRDAPVGGSRGLKVGRTARGRELNGQLRDEIGHFGAEGTESEHCQRAVAFAQQAAATDFDGFERTTPVGAMAGTARVADDKGAAAGQLCRVHEAAQLAFVHRRGEGEIGHRAKRRNVESTVVGGAVFAHESRAIQTEHDLQIEQCRVVDDVVVGALGKGAVDIAKRHHALFGHAGREGHGVAFGNAHVEGAFGQDALQQVHAAAREHGGRDADNALIGARQFNEGFAEHVLEFGRRIARFARNQAHTGSGVELSRCVPHHRVAFRAVVALALHRFDVQQARPGHGTQGAEQANERDHVVTVVGTEITDVESLENVLFVREKRLEGVVESDKAFATRGRQPAPTLEAARQTVAQSVVGRGGVEIEQVAFHPTDRVRDAHVVVVEDDEQVVGRLAHVVEPLEGQSAAHRAVADDGHHVLVGFAALHRGHTHAEGGRNGVGGVAAGEGVVFALGGRGEGTHAAPTAVGVKRVTTAGQNLVPVGLMPHVPHDAVVGRAEHVVQSHRQFDSAQTRSQVAGILRKFVENVGTQFAAELRELAEFEPAQVGRCVDVGEEGIFVRVRHVYEGDVGGRRRERVIRRRLRPTGCGGKPNGCIAASS